MNKKHKKQLDVARKKMAQLQQQLAGSRKQMDDPDEVRRLETEVKALEAQIEKILQSE